MLARIVENWLTSASERSYQGPFAQLLIAERHRVLFAPVHHAFEQGKDLIAFDPTEKLCAYQLKAGDINLTEIRAVLPQLHSACLTAIAYPGVTPPRRPDTVILVTTGQLTPPARDELRALNDGNRTNGLPTVELLEREHLVSRFLALSTDTAPSELTDLSALLRLYLADGRTLFDVKAHAALVNGMILAAGDSTRSVVRTIASSVLITAYATTAPIKSGNHLAVAQAWLSMMFCVLAAAESQSLPEEDWRPSFEVCRDSARDALASLRDEAAAADSLNVPDMFDGLVYSSRALIICGFVAGLYFCERELSEVPIDPTDYRKIFEREVEFAKAVGETSAASLYVLALALEELDSLEAAALLMVRWAAVVSTNNGPDSDDALADPYHDTEEVLLAAASEDPFGGEQFAGRSYSLLVALEWIARRDGRVFVERMWPAVTKLNFVEYIPGIPAGLLLAVDETGALRETVPNMTQSWAEFCSRARSVEEAALPGVLWRERAVLPFLPLLLPYRLTGDVGKALDWMTHGRVSVRFTEIT